MKKTLFLFAVLIFLVSAFSGGAYAVEMDSDFVRPERETDNSFVDDYIYPEMEEVTGCPMTPEEQAAREAELLANRKPYKPVDHWSQQGIEIDPVHYPITMDITKKVLAVVKEYVSTSSDSLNVEKNVLSVDATGKIISESDFSIDQATAEKIARIYRDQLDIERLKNSDDLFWTLYRKEDGVWSFIFADEDQKNKDKENSSTPLVGGLYAPVVIIVKNDGTVARVFTNGQD